MKCMISYDGTNYSGYQVQPNGRTIQEEFEKALTRMHKGKQGKITASGRTDAGVHAVGQVIHFDTPLRIPEENWRKALNSLLPRDIRIKDVVKVSDTFHARYDVTEKEYKYFILNTEYEDVFTRNYIYHIPYNLDLEAMQSACKLVEGEHDFSSFCSARTGVKGDKVRHIFEATCQKEGSKIVFTFKGSGFLYNMVRILVGTIIEIGKGERPPSDMGKIIHAKDRGMAGKTAPPQGLFLWNVVYNNGE